MIILKQDIKQRPANMTQMKCAKLAGLTQPQIARIESGNFIPRLDTYQKYLKACGKELRVVKPRTTNNF